MKTHRPTLLLWLALAGVVSTSSLSAGIAEESPDRVAQPEVPEGKITSARFADSKLFPSPTSRRT